ncbi:hypothetical protein [uncultured Gammaproteobacteria bacterium]|nr:hypothetical protein [uncultured Gammaproteobacteria bacterium]
MKKHILFMIFFWVSNTVYATQNLDLDFVYCHSSCKQDDTFSIASTDNEHIFPYASLRLKFDHILTTDEKAAFINNFRILKSDAEQLKHLHENISSLSAEGVHSSFNWINDNKTLIYTASALPAGNSYTISYPNNWLENNNISSFDTLSLTGDGIQIYEFSCPDEACYKKLTNAVSGINQNVEEPVDQSYSSVVFKDVYANKTYQDTKIRIRGHTATWTDKKSYTVKFDSDNLFEGFQDSGGDYQGPRKKLVFIAHKVFSSSNLSANKLMNDVERKLEQQVFGAALAADSYFALVIFNGRFWGAYNVSEHIGLGKGGWGTTKARTKVLGFDKKGKGMLHKATFGGVTLGSYLIEPKAEHEYEFSTRGNGVQTDWNETIPFRAYSKDWDFDFKVKVKKPKMQLKPDLSESSFPSFVLSGDGSGSIDIHDTTTQVAVSFKQPVVDNKKIKAEFKSIFDFQNYYHYIQNNRDYSSVEEWFNVDSSLISMFVIRLSGSNDHGLQNRYMFSKEKDLGVFSGATKSPNGNHYFDILWDGDLAFNRSCVPDFIQDACTRRSPLHWKIIAQSQEGRQRYINLFEQETKAGGVLTPEFYQQQIQNHLNILGNAIQLEELRWDRALDYPKLQNYTDDRFSDKEFLQNKILSLRLDSYIYPGIVSNLLKNNNAQEGLKHWDIIQNGGEGFGSGFYNNSVNKGFNTSYEWSIKEQTIDVSKFGALLDETDKVLVGAEFRDVYCGNDYLFLEVELKDEERNIIKRFSTGKRPTKAPKLCTWGNKSTEKISEIIDIPAGKSVRYITYRDGGKDREWWSGRYGVVISNAKVVIVGNLLKNNNAQEGLKHWDIIQNDGEGFGSGFYNNSVNKGFNTSYGWNIKEQTIDVSKFGALLDETDKVLVGAEFRDVYCGNDYLFLEVELKDEAHNIVKRFSTGKRPTRVPKLCTWGNKSIEKIFETIDIPAGKTVRYITYRDGGKDRERWAGRYGVVISNAKVLIETN